MSSAVLISNLDLSIDSSDLEDMFSIVGNVCKATVMVDSVSGLSQGFATVEMSTPQEARDCVLHFNGQRKEGRVLIVREEKRVAPKTRVRA